MLLSGCSNEEVWAVWGGDVSASDFPFSLGAPSELVSLSGLLRDPKSTPPLDPGVFGVFPEDPKDAKAPDPRPNADDAAEGELVDGVVKLLKGFDLLCDEASPKRRLVYVRGASALMLSLSEPFVDSESLFVL